MKSLFRGIFILVLAVHGGVAARASLLIDPTGGTVLWSDDGNYDDVAIRARPLGFDFVYFDNEAVPTIDVSTNGNLNFDGNTDYSNEIVLTPILRISPLWDDLEIVKGSGDAIIEKSVAGKYYSVTWKVHEQRSTTQHVFQAVIFGAAMRINGFDFAAGDIVFSYGSIGPSFAKGTATVALDDGAGTLVAPAGVISEFGQLLHSEAGLLPTAPGSFILFRADESGSVIASTHLNRAPQAANDTHYVSGRGPFTIDVLANDRDPDGDPLVIAEIKQGSFGNVIVAADGKLIYTPDPSFGGTDLFTYKVRDPYGLTDQATVTLIPFAAGKGVFDGLVADAPTEDEPAPPATAEGSGYFKFSLAANGAFSGTLYFGGFAQPLRGAFDAQGDFTTQFTRTVDVEVQTVVVTLHLDLANPTQPLTGTVTDGTTTSRIVAARSRFAARTFPASQAGKYTILIYPDDTGSGPPGIGFARMQVMPGGAAALAGKLGNGKPFTFSSFVKSDATLPIHLAFRTGRALRGGTLSGMLKFDHSQPSCDCSGTLAWFMPEVGDVPGIEAAPSLVGSRYVPPGKGDRVIALADGTWNASIDLADGQITKMLTITRGNKVFVEGGSDEQLGLTITAANGLFSGGFSEDSLDDTPVRKHRGIGGAFLQKKKLGGGVFIGNDGPGAVTIGAPLAP